VLNIKGGFGGAMLVYGEMKGIPTACFSEIVDSHYITPETLQAFSSVFIEVLEVSNVDFSKLHTFRDYKTVLKEENSRGHNIYG
jgi:hypothetical protein